MSETIRLTVEFVRFHDPTKGFSVVVGRHGQSADDVTFVGEFEPPDPGETVDVTGEWRHDRKYGRQFAVHAIFLALPTDRDAIERFLIDYMDGIGPAVAKRTVDHFGGDVFRILDEEPQRLREVAGIGPRTLESVTYSWRELRGGHDVILFLDSCGIRGARAMRIHQQYGVRAESIIRDNPYLLARDVRGIGFATADEIARRLGHDRRSPFRVAAGLRHLLEEARARGHCGIPADEAIKAGVGLLRVEPELVATAVLDAQTTGAVTEETIGGRSILFDPFLHGAETRIAATLARLADEAPPWSDLDPHDAVRVAEEESGIELDETQRHAVDLALSASAVVITGGPGVGKTTLVRSLLAVFLSVGLRVELAAPTGRAAKRLSESTGGSARTIHRMLETSPESHGFKRNEENPLETDVVIIDECSMVDVPLLDAVLRALPAGAAIVLVGDADQLPSIGPGQVLHDILKSQRIPSIALTKIHRQAEGSNIIRSAHRINRGEAPEFSRSGGDLFLFRAQSAEKAVEHVVDLVSTRIPRTFGIHRRDIHVLAPMRKGTAGVDALNAKLQSVLNPPAKHAVTIERPNGVAFCVHDKVMQTENNYDKGVFNGDIGVISAIDTEHESFTVDFGGELIVDYGFDEADQLTLAYATTIHKSQGSEYDAVIIALKPQYGGMLRRKLLYTAVTRGRRLVVIVSDNHSIATAVASGAGEERCTRLARCLASIGSRSVK